MKDEILTKKELADLLKVTERLIDKLREQGLPYFNVGKNIRFNKEKVLTWLEENNQK